MDMGDRLNALEVALDNESREREFYLKHAERTHNAVGKTMFKQIADEELEHYERLKELHEKWKNKEAWPETVPLKVSNSVVGDVLKDVLKKVGEKEKSDEDDLQAVRTAIDFEAKGASYYAKLRDEVANPKEKAFFNLLADIEHEHYISLKDTEEFLVDPTSWYSRVEHHGLDGA